MSGVMLNFKGKMYKLCEKKDMDRKPNKKPVEVDRKIRSDKGGTHKMPSGKEMTGKTHSKDSKPVKKAPARKAKQMNKYDKDGKLIPYKKAPAKKAKKAPAKKAPAKKAPAKKKKKKFNVVEGFPSFKGDEPKAKEEKRRDNSLY
tara:strand:- start:1681 stop:2115 length:435 start_codon:yes stop_codon:yes gene_type:complete